MADQKATVKPTLKPEEEVVTMWQTLIKQDETLASGNVNQTISANSPMQTFERQQTLGSLPRIQPDGDLSEFRVSETIGQGGMGLVRLARQTSLYREVAIKTIRPDRMNAAATRDLLRESWVSGMLEHPNIIPIHALGVDEHSAPMLVMKRVEGVSWAQVLEEPEHLPSAFKGGRDRLEDHIHILLQVCNAVQFAHSKGIIHCDLKPENTMLGEYGEVYLLDWGIAVSLVDDGTGRLPLAEDVDDTAGTPSYIAPELAGGQGELIDERTDVYLLGAILHELVTGRTRHSGESVMGTLLQAYRSAPVEYDDSVPDEMAQICNRATHLDPDSRFAGVDEFREAVARFLRHRDSRHLSEEASSRLDALQSAVSDVKGDLLEGGELDDVDRSDDAVARVYRLFAECRFGFEQALEIWADNDQARRGLHLALQVMIDFELHERDAKAAARLIDELPDSSAEFTQRLAELREDLAREAKQIQRNKQISRDVDISLASRERSIMCILLGVLFGGVPFLNHWLIEQGITTLTFQDYFIQFGVILVGSAVVVGLLRRRLFENAINARIIISVFVILGGCLIMRLLGYLLGLDPAGCIALENGLLGFAMLMMATSIDKRMWPASIAFLLGAAGGALYPDHILQFDGASNAVALWILAFVWRERSQE